MQRSPDAQAFDEIPHDIVDDIILTDDASQDATVALAQSLGIATIRHDRNRGYGSNQKTCYTEALARLRSNSVAAHLAETEYRTQQTGNPENAG